MTTKSKTFVSFALFFGVVSVLFLLFEWEPDKPLFIEIFVVNDNDHGSALIEVANSSDEVIKLDRYCTLYWTNVAGLATNHFYPHGGANSEIQPGKSVKLSIPHPSDAGVWNVSFTFYVPLTWIERVGNVVKGESFRNKIPPDTFHGRISPPITNAGFLKLSLPQQ